MAREKMEINMRKELAADETAAGRLWHEKGHEKTGHCRQGAYPVRGGGVFFRIWAPRCRKVSVKIIQPGENFSVFPMELVPPAGPVSDEGFFELLVPEAGAGTKYFYLLDGLLERPDPASRHQAEGVHGPSLVTDPQGYKWEDGGWKSPPIGQYIIYELHTGTFTREGTFLAAAERVPYLKELGVTAVEIMPVAQFPGGRNWGYDGAYPYAPQNSYGGPEGLKRLVDALHRAGIAVILDVVYNHFGPEGSYFADYGPYFTENYRTPWGSAINYDGPSSGPVREFFIENALYWGREFHMDALRLDAVHGIFDSSPTHIIKEMRQRMNGLAAEEGRPFYMFIESDRNDTRFIRPTLLGGCGADAHWNEDFHHALHVVLTGEKDGYYMDFSGPKDLLKAWAEGFVYTGQHSAYRGRNQGSPSRDLPTDSFVAFIQNHDQVGNRPLGDRLGSILPPEKLMLGAALVLLGPYVPLLFMGEEYGEKAPFQYFVSHADRELVHAVREGRRCEFSAFRWGDKVPPDPQAEETFLASKVNPGLVHEMPHEMVFDFYKKLIALRKEFLPALSSPEREGMSVSLQNSVLVITRQFIAWQVTGDERVTECKRTGGNGQAAEYGGLFAAFNLSGRQSSAVTPALSGLDGGDSGAWFPLLGTGPDGNGLVGLGPYETVLLMEKKALPIG